MLFQPYKSDFILSIIKEVESHEARSHWILMKDIEVKKKHTNKYCKLKTILSIWYFKHKRFPDGKLMKKSRLCAHRGIQQWRVNYWETNASVVNWISVRLLLVIASIN